MKEENEGFVGCGCFLSIIFFNLFLGGFSFDYCLWNIFEKNVPWFADIACGLLIGEFTFPTMIIVYILKLCGVEMPLV